MIDTSTLPCLLITGAAGALAQQVIARLRDKYRLVVCDSRREVSMPEDIPSYRVDFNKRRFEDLFKEYHFDGIIHLGRIGSNENSREGRYNANVIGSQRLLDLARKYKVKQTLILSTYFLFLLWSLQFYKIYNLLYFFFCNSFSIITPCCSFMVNDGCYFS